MSLLLAFVVQRLLVLLMWVVASVLAAFVVGGVAVVVGVAGEVYRPFVVACNADAYTTSGMPPALVSFGQELRHLGWVIVLHQCGWHT